MNKILTLLLVFTNICLISFSQITVTNSDMPAAGNMINKSTALTSGGIDYTLTGTNYNWNFSALIPVSQSVDTFVAVNSTPIIYYLSFLTSANQALKQPDMNLGLIQAVNVYNFYNKTTTAYNLAGFAAQINAIPIPLKYNTADRIYKFPLNYGNIDSSASVAAISVPSLGYFSDSKKRKNTVDGWGTLTTPYGSFSVLRIKSEIYQKDSMHSDSIPFPLPAIIRNITEYKWVGKNNGIPLLEIIETSFDMLPAFTTTINYIDSMRNLTPVSIPKPITGSESIKIYPNPAANQFSISYNLSKTTDVDIRMFDLTGKEFKIIEKGTKDKGNSLQTFNVQAEKLIKGIYFIRFQFDNSTYTRKLVIL